MEISVCNCCWIVGTVGTVDFFLPPPVEASDSLPHFRVRAEAQPATCTVFPIVCLAEVPMSHLTPWASTALEYSFQAQHQLLTCKSQRSKAVAQFSKPLPASIFFKLLKIVPKLLISVVVVEPGRKDSAQHWLWPWYWRWGYALHGASLVESTAGPLLRSLPPTGLNLPASWTCCQKWRRATHCSTRWFWAASPALPCSLKEIEALLSFKQQHPLTWGRRVIVKASNVVDATPCSYGEAIPAAAWSQQTSRSQGSSCEEGWVQTLERAPRGPSVGEEVHLTGLAVRAVHVVLQHVAYQAQESHILMLVASGELAFLSQCSVQGYVELLQSEVAAKSPPLRTTKESGGGQSHRTP